jgi:hypothetical protein
MNSTRLTLFVLFLLALPGLGCRLDAQAQDESTITIEKPGAVVRLTGIPKPYGEAFASILSEARREYAETFGLLVPSTVTLEAKLDPSRSVRLWTDGESHLFLTVESLDQLAPAPKTGIFHIYGMCHELGHIAMYSRMKDQVGMPQGIGEGWAHYAGSVVVDGVAQRLGKEIWPTEYPDVASVEGTARLKRQTEGREWADLDPDSRAAKVFYELDRKHGTKALGQSLEKALARRPSGAELMPFFLEALRETTGDSKAGDWIPQSVLTAEVEWDTQERHPDDSFFADAKTLPDETGALIYYDDGSNEGVLSTAGSGHAVFYQAPEGAWQLDAVQVFGSRYGTLEAPKEDFRIYVCDEDFKPIREFERPYGMFERGANRWVEIPLEPVAVPHHSYVCLDFNPTATKGVYVAFDENVGHSHSRSALPYSHVADLKRKCDWMIRVHLRKVVSTP